MHYKVAGDRTGYVKCLLHTKHSVGITVVTLSLEFHCFGVMEYGQSLESQPASYYQLIDLQFGSCNRAMLPLHIKPAVSLPCLLIKLILSPSLLLFFVVFCSYRLKVFILCHVPSLLPCNLYHMPFLPPGYHEVKSPPPD